MTTLGTLYLVPNTLGSQTREVQIPWVIPSNVARRAAELQFWIVENAKTARAFLSAVNHITPLAFPLQDIQMQEWRGAKSNIAPESLLKDLLLGRHVGLLSEAGLPAVADPGAEIVALAHRHHIQVQPLVGPSSLMMALMASGMNGQRFMFHGYLAIKIPDRIEELRLLEQQSKKLQMTQLWIETPYRNASMLKTILQSLSPNTTLCLAIDLSLPTETILRKTIQQWQKMLTSSELDPLNLDKRPAVFLLSAEP